MVLWTHPGDHKQKRTSLEATTSCSAKPTALSRRLPPSARPWTRSAPRPVSSGWICVWTPRGHQRAVLQQSMGGRGASHLTGRWNWKLSFDSKSEEIGIWGSRLGEIPKQSCWLIRIVHHILDSLRTCSEKLALSLFHNLSFWILLDFPTFSPGRHSDRLQLGRRTGDGRLFGLCLGAVWWLFAGAHGGELHLLHHLWWWRQSVDWWWVGPEPSNCRAVWDPAHSVDGIEVVPFAGDVLWTHGFRAHAPGMGQWSGFLRFAEGDFKRFYLFFSWVTVFPDMGNLYRE